MLIDFNFGSQTGGFFVLRDFSAHSLKTNSNMKVMVRDEMEIVINHDSIYYTNMGFDYPVRDIAGLKKLYREVKYEELKPLDSNIKR